MKSNIPALFIAITSLLFFTSRADATLTQLGFASQLSASSTRFVDSDAVGTTYAGPSVSFATNTNLLTFSRVSGAYEVDQVGVNYGASAFASGTKILSAGGFQGSGDGGAITLKFAVPVIQLGLNIEEFNTGPYTVNFTVYQGTTNLGAFSASGNDDSSLSFLGVTATNAAFTSVVFDDVPAGGSNDLLFGNVAFVPIGGSLQAAPTPEPSTLGVLALSSLFALVFRAGLKTRAKK